jgi:hypothetical protein
LSVLKKNFLYSEEEEEEEDDDDYDEEWGFMHASADHS